MNKNFVKILKCYRSQCANGAAQPCWLRRGAAPKDGINLHGFFDSETGLGESARLVYRALSTQDVKIAACNRALNGRQNEKSFANLLSDDAPYKIGITIDGLTGYKGLRYQICKEKHNIAYPFWELDSVPEKYVHYLSQYGSIWAPSKFIFTTLKECGLENVEFVRHPVDIPSQEPDFFSPSERLKILFYFDFDSFPARKNPEAAIFAFKEAFAQNENVVLTVKTRGKNDMGRRDWLAQQVAADPRIQVIDHFLDREAMTKLMREHDIFLSLHRSEGLGLGCAEALAAGKVVVATDYGGSTDFINDQTGYPVKWSRMEVKPTDYVLADGATWADPSVAHAAQMLREIYEDPSEARKRAVNGYHHLVQHHSFSKVGANMIEIINKRGKI